MDDRTRALADAPISRLLPAYSLPAIIGMTITSLYNIIAGIFIGHGVGPLAISGLAVNFPLFNLIMALCMMVAVGGATVCSIELGRKNEERAGQVLGQVVIVNAVVSVAAALALHAFIDPILTLFGASDATRPYARDYIVVLLAGLPIGFLMLGLNNVMRASGHPVKAMGTALVSVAVNIALAPLFIFSFGWGMRGAALATVLGQTASCGWLLLHFFGGSSPVRFRAGIFRFRPALCREILAVGLPPFFMNACACLVVIIINRSLNHYGGDLAIGAYGILNRLVMLFGMVVMGLTQGMQPIIGYNFGAGRPDRHGGGRGHHVAGLACLTVRAGTSGPQVHGTCRSAGAFRPCPAGLFGGVLHRRVADCGFRLLSGHRAGGCGQLPLPVAADAVPYSLPAASAPLVRA